MLTDFSDVAVVTVSTRNYLHRVRSLFASVRDLMPGALQLACSVDSLDEHTDPEQEDFELVEAAELGIPRFEQLMFALNPTAACCALKPHIAMRAFQYPGIKRVLYIDNDMGLYRSPDEMFDFLSKHSFVLTPHYLDPLPQGATPDEMTIIPYGIYNAGMFAVNDTEDATRFLEWWGNWMSDPRHVFAEWAYDQIWLNYAPVYCKHAGILHEKGYNVAFWNLAERNLTRKGETYYCDDVPLVAFHFSHFDDRRPEQIVPDYVETNAIASETTRALGLSIANAWSGNGRDECLQWDYKYRIWPSGENINESEREYVRNNWDNISPTLDLWSATVEKQEPQLYMDMRQNRLAKKKHNGNFIGVLMNLSLLKLLRKIKHCLRSKRLS